MSANAVHAATDGVPQLPVIKTSKTHSIRSSSRTQSAVSSPATGSEDSPKLEWHVCPSCKSVRRTNGSKGAGDEKSSSTTTSPTASETSQSGFCRLGLKIKKDLCGVFGHSQETTPSSTPAKGSSTPAKTKVSKSKKKKKQQQKKVTVYDKGYEELGGDHWAGEY